MNFVPLFGNWYANSARVFIFTFAFYFGTLGDLNHGIVHSMTVFSSLFNVVVFYVAFGEIVSKTKAAGMILTAGCLVFFGIESYKKKEKVKNGE